MKKLLFFSTLFLCLFSCNKTKDNEQADLALQTAKTYYDQLLHGDYNSFVEGSLKGDTVPDDYKEQLITNAQMYMEQQDEEHQGIEKIEANYATCDSTQEGNITADAFLNIYYKDGSKEEISVPMVRKNNIWYLR